VYPALVRLRGGSAVAGVCLGAQSEIEDLLVAMDRAPFDSEEFAGDSVRLGRAVVRHQDEEEEQVLPLLASLLSPRRRADLGRRFLEVKQVAPSQRVGPASRRPTGPTIVDRTTALSVWMRDSATYAGLAS
jgi:hypothetical protein